MGALLKSLLAQPDRLVRVFVLAQLCHPKFVEAIGVHGASDAVWLDQEHVGLTIPQIGGEALEEVEAIAALPGLDFLFIGPADLSQSMGLPGEWEHPRMRSAVERVAAAAKRNGVPWAILPRDPGHARRCVEMGCRVLSIG